MVTDERTKFRDRVREEMVVFGSDGEVIGRIKELYEVSFRVDRMFRRDVNVPYQAIHEVTEEGVVLSVPSDAVTPDLEDVTDPGLIPGAPPVTRKD